jgi:hypothetical protein
MQWCFSHAENPCPAFRARSLDSGLSFLCINRLWIGDGSLHLAFDAVGFDIICNCHNIGVFPWFVNGHNHNGSRYYVKIKLERKGG